MDVIDIARLQKLNKGDSFDVCVQHLHDVQSNEFVTNVRGEHYENEDETDELHFNYKPYVEENTLESHQTYDEFVVPNDQLTDDEDEELMTARENVRNYRNRLKGIAEEKLTAPVEVGILGENTSEPRAEDVGDKNVIDENIEYNEVDELWELHSSSEESGKSEYYDSSDYGSYCSDSDDEYKDVALRNKRDVIKFDNKAFLPVFCSNMEFESANQFRAAVTKYGVIKGVDVRLIKNDSNRLRAVCKGD
ncbi:hypothetical protein M5689_006967 [Euphorbia peplus]|nr:hypothetical protein M5689_006967 [Euphorbia peplus]